MVFSAHGGSQHGTWNYLRAQAYNRALDVPSPGNSGGFEPAFTTTISREAGIDAGGVARAVGARLGWPVWDHELLDSVAETLHTPARWLESIDETHVSWIKESLESFLEMHSVSQLAYVHQLVKLIDALGERGECIIVGRGAGHVLSPDATLRVRLVAPLADRAVAFGQKEGIKSLSEARRKVEQIDRGRTRFVREHFQKDPNDPTNYDVMLNVARLTVDDCAEQIIDALHAEQAAGEARRARLAF